MSVILSLGFRFRYPEAYIKILMPMPHTPAQFHPNPWGWGPGISACRAPQVVLWAAEAEARALCGWGHPAACCPWKNFPWEQLLARCLWTTELGQTSSHPLIPPLFPLPHPIHLPLSFPRLPLSCHLQKLNLHCHPDSNPPSSLASVSLSQK